MKQFIIKLPEGEELTSLSEETQSVIKRAQGQFPSGLLVGSKAVNGYELKLVMCNLEVSVFQSIITDGYPMINDDGEEVIINLGLDWEILASQNIAIDQSKILPYMIDLSIFNEEGELVSTAPVTNLTGKLQTYSGKKWMY
jgi:hypothetical protein